MPALEKRNAYCNRESVNDLSNFNFVAEPEAPVIEPETEVEPDTKEPETLPEKEPASDPDTTPQTDPDAPAIPAPERNPEPAEEPWKKPAEEPECLPDDDGDNEYETC